jgi:broad-specificity NMP kinase
MLIEFLGAPGTGKTTLARALAEDLRGRGCPATFVSMDAAPGLGRFGKGGRDLLEIGPWIVANPGQLRAAVALMRRFPQRSRLSALLRLRYWLRTLARAHRGAVTAELVILDQGCFQGLATWALFSTEPAPSAVRAVLPSLPSPAVVVAMTLPEDAIRSRLRARNYQHRQIDRLLLAEERWIGAAVAAAAEIEQAARESGCAVLRIDSRADTAAMLADQVVAILSRKRLATVVERF